MVEQVVAALIPSARIAITALASDGLGLLYLIEVAEFYAPSRDLFRTMGSTDCALDCALSVLLFGDVLIAGKIGQKCFGDLLG